MQAASTLGALALLAALPTARSADVPAAPNGVTSPRRIVEPSERVRPGLVAWHADRSAALAASKVSGKPVLLFRMLGRLDEEFC